MPDYSQMDVIDAKEDLISKGFKSENIKVEEENSDEYKDNIVFKQTPKADRKVVPEETPVTLYVSKGASTFALDNMYGYSKNRVETYLNSMGLILDERSEYTDAVPQGQVYYTVPRDGELVSKGSVVTVVFSAGKDPSTIPSTSSSSSSSSSSSTTSKEEPSKPTEETM